MHFKKYKNTHLKQAYKEILDRMNPSLIRPEDARLKRELKRELKRAQHEGYSETFAVPIKLTGDASAIAKFFASFDQPTDSSLLTVR